MHKICPKMAKMGNFYSFGAKLYHQTHKISKFSLFFSTRANPKATGTLRALGTRRYATHGLTVVPVTVERRGNAARVEVQEVGVGRGGGDRGPTVPGEARVVQVVSRVDVARADKEQWGTTHGCATSSIATNIISVC